ncbi:hypothetical protein PCC8801_4362 [Rippkaea orientalis PCC 8801]|uniref:Tyrosinase copper-binding domain-containing protein n=1 Tax=Rippkaea orientalis (strain PCC 8801 / RF-1) TaxID=41431 RepID=B7JVF1_RIPO1|nr:methylamine utilization protein MauJ [Rippkaea orientalis]ACK68284.1 hypothetical protein PCC8801_4362 [Rippkaea orientalis PCC 8801]
MEFNEAKEALKEGYIKAGLEISDEHEKELYFKVPSNEQVKIKISEKDIQEYAEFEDLRSSFKIEPVKCSMCSSNYREQVVKRSYDLFKNEKRSFSFGESHETNLYVEISTASPNFVNFFRFQESYLKKCLEKIESPLKISINKNGQFLNIVYKPQTIKIYNIQESSIDKAIERSNSVIDSCLFELSYLKDVTLYVQDKFSSFQQKDKPFQFGNPPTGDQLSLPKVDFNADTIRFYQRGRSTRDPVIQFLSFYHVLEYYFVIVSDEQLYDKLSRKINDPKFVTDHTNLDRLIQDVKDHKAEMDETEMLKLVLNKYIEESELINFIKEYEKWSKDTIYSGKAKTNETDIFGKDININVKEGHIIGNVAKRIKTIRNTLVHSSDRYERNQRFIPTTYHESILCKEIPLIKYLAEKVIIGSASNLK